MQGGALEIHTWQSSLDDLEHPDQIVMDLDPGEGVAWTAVIEAARTCGERLEDAGLAAFVKTSGGKGLHVVAPLKPTPAPAGTRSRASPPPWPRSMAADEPGPLRRDDHQGEAQGQDPDRLPAQRPQQHRGRRLFGTRARPGAPVSMPLAWDELGPEIGPAHFTVAERAGAGRPLRADPWADFRDAAEPLPRQDEALDSPDSEASPVQL